MSEHCPRDCPDMGGYNEEVAGAWYCKALRRGLLDNYDFGATSGPNRPYVHEDCPHRTKCPKWRDDEISRLQSDLAAERKRREEAEKMVSLTAKVLGSLDTKTHCLHCWAEEIMKELGLAHDDVQTLRADNARLRVEMARILDSGNLFEHYDIARAALNREPAKDGGE